MKDTKFEPGEYAKFPNSEIPAMLDLLRDNGHAVYESDAVYQPEMNVILCSTDCDMIGFWADKFTQNDYTELTREQFLHKATRGNGIPTSAENAPVGFDPSLPWETNFDGSSLWIEGMHYIGMDHDGKHVVRNKRSDGKTNVICSVEHVRNVQPEFDSTMLLAGQYMRVDDNHYPQYKDEIICRTDENHIVWVSGLTVFREGTTKLKGRRVDVDLIVIEV